MNESGGNVMVQSCVMFVMLFEHFDSAHLPSNAQ